MFKTFDKEQKEKELKKEQNKIDRIIQGISNHIEKQNLDIEYGYTIEDKFCFSANWNNFDKLESFLSNWETYLNIDLLWSDCADTCCDCGKYYSTQPSYYGDEIKAIWASDCEKVCFDCADILDIEEYYKNQYDKALPSFFIEDIQKCGYICLDDSENESCHIFENGFHPGQNDTPADIIKDLEKDGYLDKYDYIFCINSISQFDCHFSLFLKEL